MRVPPFVVAVVAAALAAPPASAMTLPGATSGSASTAAADPGSWCEPSAGGYTCMIGPFKVGWGKSVKTTMSVTPPPEAGYITWARATLVDGQGSAIAQHMVHFHHAVWLNPNREDTTCDHFGSHPVNPERFFASGKERTPMALPDGFGYHWDNEPFFWAGNVPTWYFNTHLDGHHGHPETYVKLRMGFVPEAEAGDTTPITPVWLDVRNCEMPPTWTVKEGSGKPNGVARKKWTFEMPVGGRFVTLGGHLHDGGLKLRLRNLATQKTVFTSRALYEANHPWKLTGMTGFAGVPGKEVEAGQKLRLIAFYDSTHTWSQVMGIMVGALAPA